MHTCVFVVYVFVCEGAFLLLHPCGSQGTTSDILLLCSRQFPC